MMFRFPLIPDILDMPPLSALNVGDDSNKCLIRESKNIADRSIKYHIDANINPAYCSSIMYTYLYLLKSYV